MAHLRTISLLIVLVTYASARDFLFGIATSAMQVEGAWLENGRTLTVWDNIAHTMGSVADNTTADVVADSYHRFDQDIALMKEYGIAHYRLSIQWTRILPRGVAGSPINFKAVEHYRRFLQMLKDQGIVAYVNLFHNDIPAILAINGTGKADPEFPEHFAYYADICFKYFGDLVPYWFTFDEPWCQSVYESSQPYEANIKPYLVAHNLLLAHSEAVHIYRKKYQPLYKGKIGINLIGEMAWPLNSESEDDVEAAERNLVFQLGWFADPLVKGDYPELMKEIAGIRLPSFTEEQKAKLKGSIDFFAVNHYYSYMVKHGGHKSQRTYWDDVNVTKSYKKDWKRTDMDWPIVPEGLHDLLVYVYQKWVKDNPMEIWVTENGLAVAEPDTQKSLNDFERIEFMKEYLSEYFAWSLLDNFEWGSGTAKRFGLTRVEYGNNPQRIPKASMNWYAKLINE